MAGDLRCCTFHLDELWVGIEVARVQEVFPSPAISPVPLAPAFVAGLVNLRGQIVTVVDLWTRLGLAQPDLGLPPAMVVVIWEDCLFGLLVARIGEMVTAPGEDIEAAPAHQAAELRRIAPKVCKFPARLLLLLDLNEVLRGGVPSERSLAVK